MLDSVKRKEIIAAAMHQAWFAHSVIGLGQEGKPWLEAAEDQKSSTYHMVTFWDTFDKLPDNKSYLAEVSHVVWMKQKRAAGWTLGSTRDPVAKTHPNLVPYAELSKADKDKDMVIVEAYLTMRSVLGDA
jgi:hypothetical protein